jgi:hypothetical protein
MRQLVDFQLRILSVSTPLLALDLALQVRELHRIFENDSNLTDPRPRLQSISYYPSSCLMERKAEDRYRRFHGSFFLARPYRIGDPRPFSSHSSSMSLIDDGEKV